MKNILLTIFVIVLSLSLTGCLTIRQYTVTINIKENSDIKDIVAVYEDIRSGQEIKKDENEREKMLNEDFLYIVKCYQNNDYLLDLVDNGVYVKNRELYEENATLCMRVTGITRNFKPDGAEEGLRIIKDERVLSLKKDDDEEVSSDGTITETEDRILISWPKDQKSISWTVKTINDDKDVILLPLVGKFREWKKSQN